MKHFTLPLFFLLVVLNASAQATVSTVVDSTGFKFTDDLILDNSGNLFCADYSGDAVYKLAPNETLSTFISGLNTPNGMAFDSNGDLFVCDNLGNAIYKVDPLGNFLDTFQVSYPSGIIKDAASDTMIFTTYGSQNDLKKLAPDGSITDFYVGGALDGPVGLEYCQGSLYVANFNDRKIFRIENDTLEFIAQLPGNGYLGFITCAGDQLLATAFSNHKIFKIDPQTGAVNIYAGIGGGYMDGTLDVARFTSPNGILATPLGDTIYVSEYNTGRLRMITGYELGLVDSPTVSKIRVRPNPASEFIYVSTENLKKGTKIKLYNLNGMLVKTVFSSGNTDTYIDLNSLESGVYLLNIDGVSGSQRIVKVD